MSNKLDLTGQQFGFLTIIGTAPNNGIFTRWLCKCQRCGIEKVMRTMTIKHPQNKSCGCYRNDRNKIGNRIHGLSSKRLYKIWIGMKCRCYNPKNSAYHNYGARGIAICNEWKMFLPFYQWAISNGYTEGLTIERIDVNGDYWPDNCTWIPKREQSYNMRSNRMITFKGVTKSIHEWSIETGLSIGVIRGRVDILKWGLEDVFSKPKGIYTKGGTH